MTQSSGAFNPAGTRVLVAGLGVTGRGVSRVLSPRGSVVMTVDADGEADRDVAGGIAALQAHEVDLVVTSPGWKPTHPLLVAARAAGVPVWSEVELAWRMRVPTARTGKPAPWLAVTGTNGKTTTVTLLADLLTAAGHDARAVGNVGSTVVEAVLDPQADILSVELSSFQLHHTYSMSALGAIVLNVAADHLDWHGGMDAYAAAKAKVYHRVQRAAVYPVGDVRVTSMVEGAEVSPGALAVGVTTGVPRLGQVGLVEDLIVDRAFHLPFDDPHRGETALEIATVADVSHLAGPDGTIAAHTWADVLAAVALARCADASPDAIARGLRDFHVGRHRIEVIPTSDSVTWVDDSKATNAHAAAASLTAFPDSPIVWIAGGLAKGARFDDLVAGVRDRLRAVVLIGVDDEPMRDALARHAPQIPVVRVDPSETGGVMSRAVDACARLAQPGDTVLLAPACASMDQFRSYADRGDQFASAVRQRDSSAGVTGGR